jgi:hypothetical protein
MCVHSARTARDTHALHNQWSQSRHQWLLPQTPVAWVVPRPSCSGVSKIESTADCRQRADRCAGLPDATQCASFMRPLHDRRPLAATRAIGTIRH